MEEPKEKRDWTALFILIASCFAGLLPHAVYYSETLAKVIPSREVWFKDGGNHGPWVGSWEEGMLNLCVLVILALMAISVLRPLAKIVWLRSIHLEFAARHILLLVFQAFLLGGMFYSNLLWVID